ncbi:MAG: HDIG domain-containing protein [Paludibacteraceae bacterium]|nr:HDIG domain-containing protein [Paludibacteraceae bacterium]
MKIDTSRKIVRTCLSITLYVLLVVLTGYMLPSRTGAFKYHFEQGKPWHYELLTADRDFPVYKSEAQLQKEREQALADYVPYFNVQSDAATVQTNAVLRGGKAADIDKETTDYLSFRLRSIYTRGVASASDMEMLEKNGYEKIKVVDEQHVAATRQRENLYTPRTAYDAIMANAPGNTERVLRELDLNLYLIPNLTYDASASDKARESLLAAVSLTEGMVQQGQRIIDKGEIVSEHTYRLLNSMRIAAEDKSADPGAGMLARAGNILLVVCFVLMLVLYLASFRPALFDNFKNNLFFCTLIALICTCAWIVRRYTTLSIYLVPIAWIPVLIRVFYDSRTGFFIHLVTTLIIAMTVSAPMEFVILNLMAGLVAVSSLRDMTQRAQLARAAAFIFLTYSIVYTIFVLASTGSFEAVDPWSYLYFAINGILVLLAYGLIYICERLFGFISAITLVELTNVNSNLMLRFAEQAPGTFQHSLQVSNLATEAAKKIGANTLLVRTGALYHDIGKLSCPQNFTENQADGNNPLTAMSEAEAAQTIISHVSEGVRMARKHHLPAVIINFIESHHGTSKVRYFYNTYVNKHPGEPVDERLFTYPGPKPSSKEAVILMMADAVEARSRSLSQYTEESISQMVEQMVAAQIADGQFSEARLSFYDMETVKAVFKEKLIQMNHHRIAYPELKNKPAKS